MNMLFVIFGLAAIVFLSSILGKKVTILIVFAIVLFGAILSATF